MIIDMVFGLDDNAIGMPFQRYRRYVLLHFIATDM